MVWHDAFPLGPMKAGLWPVRNIANMISADPKGDGQAKDVQVSASYCPSCCAHHSAQRLVSRARCVCVSDDA